MHRISIVTYFIYCFTINTFTSECIGHAAVEVFTTRRDTYFDDERISKHSITSKTFAEISKLTRIVDSKPQLTFIQAVQQRDFTSINQQLDSYNRSSPTDIMQQTDYFGHTAFMLSILTADTKLFDRLLKVPSRYSKTGNDVNHLNMHDRHGRTPLILAAGCGNLDMIKQLLALDSVNMELVDYKGRTALVAAANHDHTEVCKAILEKLAHKVARCFRTNRALAGTLKIFDRRGRDVLMFATIRNNHILVDMVLQSAKQCFSQEEFIEYINRCDFRGITALRYAFLCNHPKIVEQLTRAGAQQSEAVPTDVIAEKTFFERRSP